VKLKLETIDLNLYHLWIYFSILALASTAFFRTVGELVVYKTINQESFLKFLTVFMLRTSFLLIPPELWVACVNCELKSLFIIILIVSLLISLFNLILNSLIYRSFVFLILSFSDFILIYIGIIYISLFYRGLALRSPCTLLTGFIIIIPLFAQVAYYVADGVARYSEIWAVLIAPYATLANMR